MFASSSLHRLVSQYGTPTTCAPSEQQLVRARCRLDGIGQIPQQTARGGLSRAKLGSQHAVNTTLQIGAFALDQLSDSALRMGFGEIAKCHTREAVQLRRLAQGRQAKPVGCRPKVYPTLGKGYINRLASTGDMATIDRLTKDWAKQTWSSGLMTVTYNRRTSDDQAPK